MTASSAFARITLASALCLITGLAVAQVLEPIPEPPPIPSSVPASPAVNDNPAVTVLQRGDDMIEEYRYRGRLYMLKVTPRIGPAYFLMDIKGDGNMVRKDSLDKDQPLPRWTLINW